MPDSKPSQVESMPKYCADFLFPHEKGSVEEAGYEFANAKTEGYQRQWWEILLWRIADKDMD